MKYQIPLLGLALGGLLFAATSSQAVNTVYFSDNFQSGLGQWTGSEGVIVTDSTYGDALGFNSDDGGYDFHTIDTVPGNSYINFAYKGTGGFLAVTGSGWLAGETIYYGVPLNLPNSTTWTSYSVFVPAGGNIAVEDYSGVPGSQYLTAEFADITDSSAPLVAAPSSVPDGATTSVLLGGALMGLSFLRRKLS
jgi:hypothetical protein